MIGRFLKSCLALFAVALCSTSIHAQTIWVSAGVDASGVTKRIEVYQYNYVTEKPCFPGGDAKLLEFKNANRKYPAEAYSKGIQGRVTCWFVVNADGSISHLRVIRGVNPLLDEEALRVFSLMPPWVPGKIDGIPVPVTVVESISFRK